MKKFILISQYRTSADKIVEFIVIRQDADRSVGANVN